ncbi:MAG: hypothetical protein ABSG84_16660 [Acidobacteriaceae bacterium]|jgi:hypothetical protein
MGLPWCLIRSIFAAACFLLAACGTTAKAQSGLLLGLHRESDENGREIPHRTLWIAPQAGTLKIMELPDLIVPRKTGFWRVGTRFYCDPDELKEAPHKAPSPDGAFFAAPVNQRPTVYGVVPCPEHVQYLDTEGACGDDVPDGASGIDVSFVNDEYISLNDWGRTDCGGHPDGSNQYRVERLGDSPLAPIAYGDVEGSLATNDYEWRAADALLENASRVSEDGHKVPLGEGDTDEDKEIRENFPKWSNMTKLDKVTVMQTLDDGCFPKHDDKEWYITRKNGGWHARGGFDTHRLCGVAVDFELPLHANIAEPVAGPISLDVIKNRITIKDASDLKMIKGVKDLFWSPNHELLVVLINMDKACVSSAFEYCTPEQLDPDDFDETSLLQVYSPHGQDLGKPIISMQLKAFEKPVMAEWATGSSVARWTAALRKIKAQGMVKPILSSSSHP